MSAKDGGGLHMLMVTEGMLILGEEMVAGG